MKGFIENIEKSTRENDAFRRVLYTAHYSQLVLMALQPGEEIGEETHGVDQFFRIESGTGRVAIDGVVSDIGDGSAVIVPAGASHNIINTGSEPLRLYTIYTPPHHRDQIVHDTKAAAEADDEEFDGKTTE